MGFRVLLLSITGAEPAEIHRRLAVTAGDAVSEYAGAPVNGMRRDDGRYWLFINDEIDPDRELLGPLSAGCAVLACYANETVMMSQVTAWLDGRLAWSVDRDCNLGPEHLATMGAVPAAFAAIAAAKRAEQRAATAEVDHLFDVPVELFAALGGFRYDQDHGGWRVLERLRPAMKPAWWAFWR